MTQEQAKEIAQHFLSNDENKSIFVTSDHAVYINSDLETIQAHCEANKLELFIIKSDDIDLPKKKAKK